MSNLIWDDVNCMWVPEDMQERAMWAIVQRNKFVESLDSGIELDVHFDLSAPMEELTFDDHDVTGMENVFKKIIRVPPWPLVSKSRARSEAKDEQSK